MPRLTIIGTSHVAALKEGWDAIAAQRPEWRVTFFATTSRYFRELRLSPALEFGLLGRRAQRNHAALEAVETINAAASTRLAEADVVLWSGFQRPLERVAEFVAARDVEGLLDTGARPLVPRAAFDAFCDELARTALPPDRWLGWTRPKLVLAVSPIPGETLLAGDCLNYRAWAALAARPGDKRPAFAAFLDRHEAALAGRGVSLLRQPADTILASGLTAAAYTAGSRRLRKGGKHPSDDHRHMNAAYGRRALEALLDGDGPRLAAEAGAAPAPPAGHKAARRLRRAALGRAAAPETAPLEAAQTGGARAPAADADAAPAATPTTSPYANLPARAYWRTGVAARAPLDPGDLYRPRFPITRTTRIATAGSCFAQHVGRALREAGFAVLDAEPPPARIAPDAAAAHGYGLFSGRYGNLYTARQLAQLFEEVERRLAPALPVWRKGARFFDAQRPGVEPDGLDSEARVLRHRERHLAALRGMFRETDVFVFTFGLTEAWIHRASGTVYPTAPGTIAGAFDPEVFAFRNYDATEALADFEEFRAALLAVNPGVRFLVTVSPAPLTATASGEHVEVASAYSKAVLRAVCGMLVARHADVDYFPSFEIITSQNARGAYFEPNLRSVSPAGVRTVMQVFLRAHGAEAAPDAASAPPAPDAALAPAAPRRRADRQAGEPCEDALLDAFAK